ncbi:hypothetical protein ACLOJK_037611, partial [Asimina triloba]
GALRDVGEHLAARSAKAGLLGGLLLESSPYFRESVELSPYDGAFSVWLMPGDHLKKDLCRVTTSRRTCEGQIRNVDDN